MSHNLYRAYGALAQDSPLHRNYARAFKALSVMLQAYTDASGQTGLSATNSQKLFTVLMKLRPELNRQAYVYRFGTRGPVTESKAVAPSDPASPRQKLRYITDHLKILCSAADLDYLTYVETKTSSGKVSSAEFRPNVSSQQIRRWIGREQLDDALVQDAQALGFAVGKFSPADIENFANAFNVDVVCDGMTRDWRTGAKRLLQFLKPGQSAQALHAQVHAAWEEFEAARHKSAAYAAAMPRLQSYVEQQLQFAEQRDRKLAERVRIISGSIRIDTDNTDFRMLTSACLLLSHVSAYAHHVLGLSPLESSADRCDTIEPTCDNQATCERCLQLIDAIRDRGRDVLFTPPRVELLDSIRELHVKWYPATARNIDPGFWTDMRDFSQRVVDWIRTPGKSRTTSLPSIS